MMRSIGTCVFLAALLAGSVAFAQEEEEIGVGMQELRSSLASTLTSAERGRIATSPTRPAASPRSTQPIGGLRAHKIEFTPGGRPQGPFAFADQAVHGFLVQALIGAGQGTLAQRVRSLPQVRDAATARSARVALQRLSRLSGAARPAVTATIFALGAATGPDASRATARALGAVVAATLRAGADRAAVVDRAVALANGDWPATTAAVRSTRAVPRATPGAMPVRP